MKPLAVLVALVALFVACGVESDGHLTPEQCFAAGGDVIFDPGGGSITSCPEGTEQLGIVRGSGTIEAAFCCRS